MSGSFQPRNAKELANTLRGCAAESRRVRVSGGGIVARDPSAESLGLWMFGITGVTEIRPDDLVATAKAGTALAEIDTELRERGRRFPLRPHDFGERATIGGAFAAGADGLVARLGFRARDVLLAARAVLASGDSVAVGAKVVKSVAGFDVCKALVGSRGCLAAITEVTFRIEAIPERAETFTAVFGGRTEAHAALAIADALPLSPSGLVVSQQQGSFRIDVLVEGPGTAVAQAARRLDRVGFAKSEGDWARLTSFAALPPPAGHTRFVGHASRAAPLTSVPADATAFLVDVLRSRLFAHVPGAPAPAPLNALLDRVRKSFDPGAIFEPGSGLGNP